MLTCCPGLQVNKALLLLHIKRMDGATDGTVEWKDPACVHQFQVPPVFPMQSSGRTQHVCTQLRYASALGTARPRWIALSASTATSP